VNTWSGNSYLEVHVYDNSGNISGASTEVWSTAKGQDVLVATQRTNGEGLTVFELPAGTNEVRVHISASTTNYASETVTLRSGETRRVEFCTNCDQ
jgi:phenylpropionate dioxygenase-like ring-hydroxylating dioxygenase large terminal subunit